VNWAGLAVGVGLAVVAAAVLYHVSVRRARRVAASASADRVHDLRVISVQMRRAAILGGLIGAACCFAPAHWPGTGRGPFIGSGGAVGTILVCAACLALPSMAVQRPVVAAMARLRDIQMKAMRSYRVTTTRAIGVVVALWPLVLAIAVSASLTIKIIVVVAGYLVVCPVLTGLLAPACALLLAPGALPADVEERLTRLAGTAGVRARGRTIPARARKAAVATQLGWVPGLRFVLVTDYLVDELAPSGVDAVLAHELAHARHHDYIVRYMIRTVSFVPAMVALVSLASGEPTIAVIVLVFALAINGLFMSALRPRAVRQELAADDLAARLVGPAALMTALTRLAELNMVKLDTSPGWDESVGHPGIARRIEQLEKMASATGAPS
jgi:STE24 endopeptidase